MILVSWFFQLLRSSEEDLKKLYENIPDSIWHQQPPTLHGEWRIFDDHQDHHHDGFSFGEGDFFQEFEEMLQNFFRGSPFHSGPQLKGIYTWREYCLARLFSVQLLFPRCHGVRS